MNEGLQGHPAPPGDDRGDPDGPGGPGGAGGRVHPAGRDAGEGAPESTTGRWGAIDHTADVAFWVEAPTLPGLFHTATVAVLGILLERPPQVALARAAALAPAQPAGTAPVGPSPVAAGPPATPAGAGHRHQPESPAASSAEEHPAVHLTAPDIETLLVRWINELLYWVQDRRRVPVALAWDLRPAPAAAAAGRGAAAGQPEHGGPGGAGRSPRPEDPCREPSQDAERPGNWTLDVAGRWIPLDPDAMGWQGEIKAATYHQLEVVRRPGGDWRAQVVLDV
ncbi:protein of unknown function DUF101 [Thermaerobacter marianensis DSM 12885]|uniref:Archease domain-containing protein n=1 Tax=Thermaerobacter marianensis (strain ATCC 700841 / DSM 12885 / JCM 10246 / 7p75a) TaxID=644966 RepID=E6SJL3_THEM7|nr:archease [Thermaerobacter marianensis]ADU52168.1 protein of unknown function DUF101 [Thermaerobacter marianensis DSM 12885]